MRPTTRQIAPWNPKAISFSAWLKREFAHLVQDRALDVEHRESEREEMSSTGRVSG
jgi:hypothetical protein